MTSSSVGEGSSLADRTAPWLIFVAFVLAWTLFHALAAPGRASTDVYIFRDPGCNCAAGEGLVSRSMPQEQSVKPELFAGYTPGAPLLFAIPAKLFGCKAYVDVFFNLLIAALSAGLVLYGLLRGVTSKPIRLASSVLIGAMLPTGLLSVAGDRPEAPAFCLLAILLLSWRADRSFQAMTILAGLNGLVFLIHPFAGVIGCLLFCFLLIFTPEQPEGPVTRGSIAGAGLLFMTAIIGLWALVMWCIDPASLHRFLQHATGTGTGVGVLLQSPSAVQSRLGGYVTAFHRVFNSETILADAGIISLLLAFIAVALFLAFSRSPNDTRRSSWLQFVSLAAILLGVPALLFPAQANYFELTRATLLLMVVLGGFDLSELLRKSKLPLILVGLSFLLLTPSMAISALDNIESRASYRHATEQAQRTADYFARNGVQDPAILVSVSEYFLYKPYFSRLYAPEYLVFLEGRKDYDGLVLCYTTKLAFTHDELPWPEGFSKDGWQLIENGQDSLRISLFGKPVMRRNWTWSCDVYAYEKDAVR